MSNTKPRIKKETLTNIQIIGENILYDNGKVTAYYILPTVNYSVATSDAVVNAVDGLYDMVSSVANTRPEISFTIEKINKVVRAKDVKKNLLETIKIYSPSFELPYEFNHNLGDEYQKYCLIGFDIEENDLGDIEDLTIRETLKSVRKSIIDKLAGLGNKLDLAKILNIEKNIYEVISYKCQRASKELVFYNYISKLYPNYEISYDKLSFIKEENFESIMGAATQTVTDNFGHFVLHNDGVDLFDLPQQDTFGCVLEVKDIPLKVRLDYFNMDFEGAQLHVKLLKKEKAAIKLKRIRANDTYEAQEAINAAAEDELLDDSISSIDLTTNALKDLKHGQILCEFNFHILITAITLEELRIKIREAMTALKSADITAVKSLTQAESFVDNYIRNTPKELNFFAPLYIPLASQLNSGSIVGDIGTGFYSPAIGEDII